jgi:mono/diheme cytochrome c family protein
MMHGDGPSAVELNPRPRTLTRGDYMNKKSNLELFTVIKGGGEAVSLSSSMPNWGNVLQDQDIWNIVASSGRCRMFRRPRRSKST